MILLDIVPYPDDRYRRIPRVVYDTIDTVAPPVNEIIDPAAQGGGDTSTMLWTLLTALAALSACLFMVQLYRRRRLASQTGV